MSTAEFTYTPSTADTTFFADGISDTSLSFILTNTDIPDGLTQRVAHRVIITNDSNNDQSDKILTITGTDEEDKILIENITGSAANPPSATFVITTGYFKTLENPKVNTTTSGDTFSFGFVDEFVSAPYPVGTSFVKVDVGVKVTGTINYDIECTLSDIFNENKADWIWQPVIAGQTTDILKSVEQGAYAVRFKANSYSAGAGVRFQIMQTYNKLSTHQSVFQSVYSSSCSINSN